MKSIPLLVLPPSSADYLICCLLLLDRLVRIDPTRLRGRTQLGDHAIVIDPSDIALTRRLEVMRFVFTASISIFLGSATLMSVVTALLVSAFNENLKRAALFSLYVCIASTTVGFIMIAESMKLHRVL